jgi:glucose/arabinose dehydrogenase
MTAAIVLSAGRRAWVLVLVAALVGSACGGDDDDGEAGLSATTSSTDAATSETTAGGAANEAAPLDGIELTLTPVMEADRPMALVDRPGSSTLYLAERAGRVRPVTDMTVGDPVLDISDMVVADVERGLLDIEFSRDGGTLYVSYSLAPDGDTRVVAYTMDGDAVDAGSRRELLAVDQPFPNHNGGDVEIGPDGYLYMGLGDGGSAGDPMGNGQDTNALLGKLLRFDPSAPAGGKQYGIPADNPFADGGGAPEVWTYGLRNPWRYTFDPATGDLWIADVGQNQWEEIDMLPAASGAGRAANLGWAEMEASHPYQGGSPPEGAVAPVFEYSHDEGCSITGGVVYRGNGIPGLTGTYLFTDYCQSRIRGIRVDGGRVSEQKVFDAEGDSLVSFGVDTAGEVYVLSLDGPIYRLDPA